MTILVVSVLLSLSLSAVSASSHEPRYMGMGEQRLRAKSRDSVETFGSASSDEFEPEVRDGWYHGGASIADDHFSLPGSAPVRGGRGRSHAFDGEGGAQPRWQQSDNMRDERPVPYEEQQDHLRVMMHDFQDKEYRFTRSVERAQVLFTDGFVSSEPFVGHTNRFFDALHTFDDRRAAWQEVSDVYTQLWLSVLPDGDYEAAWAAIRLAAALDKYGRTHDLGRDERQRYEYSWRAVNDLVAVALYCSYKGSEKVVNFDVFHTILQDMYAALQGIKRKTPAEDRLMALIQNTISHLVPRHDSRRRDLGKSRDERGMARRVYDGMRGGVRRAYDGASRWWSGS